MDKIIQISKVEQDVLPYRMDGILRDVFVMLLKMIDMDCNEEGKYQNIIERLEQERVPRLRPSSKLKAAVDSCYQEFFRIGYVSTLCYVLCMHLWQSMECDTETFTKTASALTKVSIFMNDSGLVFCTSLKMSDSAFKYKFLTCKNTSKLVFH